MFTSTTLLLAFIPFIHHVTSQGWQFIPPGQNKTDNTYADTSVPKLNSEPDKDDSAVDPIYGVHDTDIHMGRLHLGHVKFFAAGQLNSPTNSTDAWGPNVIDFANQSACGIPDAAFSISKVAIHPYHLKYAPDNLGLSRMSTMSITSYSSSVTNARKGFCMQDVSVAIIRADWQSDMIMKVTDVCCTDTSDPSCCHDPTEIKVDRTKMQILYGYGGPPWNTFPELAGTQLLDASKAPVQANWFFTKSWDDSLVQPAYRNNWWADPPLQNNEQVDADAQQVKNNANTYPQRCFSDGSCLQPYPLSGYNSNRHPWNITDWDPNNPIDNPAWAPVGGGWGWGDGKGSSTWKGAPSVGETTGGNVVSGLNGTAPSSGAVTSLNGTAPSSGAVMSLNGTGPVVGGADERCLDGSKSRASLSGNTTSTAGTYRRKVRSVKVRASRKGRWMA
ncbi:MAG: hypothetical protein M1828_001598 [Chrysothrix sp. TS-e1954]|nr:MAG: hypothetical protein M1828_001598 [Chrysothrix sp. TS-e1954]